MMRETDMKRKLSEEQIEQLEVLWETLTTNEAKAILEKAIPIWKDYPARTEAFGTETPFNGGILTPSCEGCCLLGASICGKSTEDVNLFDEWFLITSSFDLTYDDATNIADIFDGRDPGSDISPLEEDILKIRKIVFEV